VLIHNDRQWAVDQVSFPVDAALTVQGLADGGTATVTFTRENIAVPVSRIADVNLAQELAQRIRTRVAGG
jgi:hypothetical protein